MDVSGVFRPAAAVGLMMACASIAHGATTGDTNALGIEKQAFDGQVPADRPGFFDNVNLVPQGYFVAEGGVRFDDNHGGGTTTTGLSGLLLRTGLTEDLEFRLGFNGYQWNSAGEDGPGDASVGFKVRIHEETTWTPAFSLLPTVSLPVGDDAVSPNKPEPELHFVFAKSVTDTFSLYSNVNLAQRLDETTNNYDLETAIAFAGGYLITDQLSAYGEYYTILPNGAGRDTHAIDAGLSYFPMPSIQLDTYVGTGLNDTASSIFGGVGIAKLF